MLEERFEKKKPRKESWWLLYSVTTWFLIGVLLAVFSSHE
jgi:hypothetical protein